MVLYIHMRAPINAYYFILFTHMKEQICTKAMLQKQIIDCKV